MTVTSVTFSKANEPDSASALAIRKSDLEAMRDRAAKAGNGVPQGLDTLINRFDEVAGAGGALTMRQVRALATEQGTATPAAAMDTFRSSSQAPGSGQSTAATADRITRVSSGEVSAVGPDDAGFASEGQLKLMATRGDATAVRELEKRALAKGTAPAAI